jgi:hypothetical protein
MTLLDKAKELFSGKNMGYPDFCVEFRSGRQTGTHQGGTGNLIIMIRLRINLINL